MNPDNPFSSGPGKTVPEAFTSDPALSESLANDDAKQEVSGAVSPAGSGAPVRPVPASASSDLPPLEMDETSCRTCQFCHFEGESRGAAVEGECRYNAPRPGIDERAAWPLVAWNSWCGQWNSGISNDDMVKMARVVADRMADGGSFTEQK